MTSRRAAIAQLSAEWRLDTCKMRHLDSNMRQSIRPMMCMTTGFVTTQSNNPDCAFTQRYHQRLAFFYDRYRSPRQAMRPGSYSNYGISRCWLPHWLHVESMQGAGPRYVTPATRARRSPWGHFRAATNKPRLPVELCHGNATPPATAGSFAIHATARQRPNAHFFISRV